MNAFQAWEWLTSVAMVERFGWVLIHSLWQFALVALAARVTVQAMRRHSAAMRYGVLVAALAVSVVAPAATWWQMIGDNSAPVAIRVEPAPDQSSSAAIEAGIEATPLTGEALLEDERESARPAASRPALSAASSTRSEVSPQTAAVVPSKRSWSTQAKQVVRPWLAWIVGAWSVGVVLCSARPVLGWSTLRRLQRVGVSPASNDMQVLLHRVSEQVGRRHAVRLMLSTLTQVPMVVGYVRPVILLPVSLVTSIPPAQLEAILAHELAHVRRHDFVVNLLQTLVETLFFYHPAVWWLSQQIRIEREHCCDDFVVQRLGNRVEYSRALLAIDEMRGQSTVLALGANDGSLLSRVRRIVGINSDRAANPLWSMLCLATCCLGVILGMSALGWHSLADESRDRKTTAPSDARPDNNGDAAAEATDSALTQAGLRTLRKPALLLPDHWNVMSVGFDHDGKELVTASTQSFATIRRWDLVGKKLISEIKLAGDKHGRSFREGTLMLSADCRRVIAATYDYVGTWETATGQLVKTLSIPKVGDNDIIRLLACTPDLSVIAGSLATNYSRTTLFYDAHTVVWDVASGKVRQTITHKNGTDTIALTLSADGKWLATTNGGGASIWDTSTGKQLLTVPNDNANRKHSDPGVSSLYTDHVWSLQFSPSGQQLAIGDLLGVKLVDSQSGALLHQLDAPYRFSSSHTAPLVFSNDGSWLARLGTGDKNSGYVVPIWSTQTGQKLFELHTESNDAAFSDDGQRFAVGFSDRQLGLAVWELSGTAANVEQPDGPGTESRIDKVEENGHYLGKKAAEFVDQMKPIWGEATLGIQYGIALAKPQHQFRIGERVPLVVFFRNARDRPLKIDMRPDFFGNTPKVVNTKGMLVEFENVALLGSIPHYVENLEPGEAVGPFYLNFGLGENPRPGKQHWHPYYRTPLAGQYKLTHSVSIDVVDADGGNQSQRAQITSGQIELEIVAGGKLPAQRETDQSRAAILEVQAISLADAVRDFNAENKKLQRGLDQPLLTEDEAVAAIQFDRTEKMLLAAMFPPVLLLPLLFFFTPLLSFADYHVAPLIRWAGAAVMAASL
jgi:beta-lactamase regulating signal transducer with metallopeptidase domain